MGRWVLTRGWATIRKAMDSSARILLCALAVGLALGCKTVSHQRRFNPEGVYRHAYTELAFPEQVGSFERIYVTEYDPDSANVSGHYQGPNALPTVATVYHYPANASSTAPTRDEFVAHFEQTMRDIERESPSARVTSKGGIEAMINGFEMSGAHARFTIADFPAYSGPTESHLYLFALGGWYLKFRLSHPAEIASEVSPREKAFIESFTWPIPEEQEE